MSQNERTEIPRSARQPWRQDFPPVIEPPLQDIPEFDGPAITDDVELFESAAMEGQPELERLRHLAEERALADGRVQRQIGDKRYTIIGTSVLEDKEQQYFTTILVIYNYDDKSTLEVSFSGEDELEILDVTTAAYQPAPGDEEIERVIQLAREDPRVSSNLSTLTALPPPPMPPQTSTPPPDEFETSVILASAVELGDRFHGRRCFSVGFGLPEERLPRLQVLVDLGSEQVLSISSGVVHGQQEGGTL